MKHDGVSPTVGIWLYIPTPLPTGGWTWGIDARFASAIVREYVYNCHEMCMVIRACGAAVARLVRPSEVGSFILTAHRLDTRRPVCRDQWDWNIDVAAFRPNGDPLCVWTPAHKHELAA